MVYFKNKGAPLVTLTEYFCDQFLQVTLTKSREVDRYNGKFREFFAIATSKKLVVPGVVVPGMVIQKG